MSITILANASVDDGHDEQRAKLKSSSSSISSGGVCGYSYRTHAILSAYLSILAGAIEAGLSLWYGHSEISMSLYSIALMAFVDITGSVLVLFMWQRSSKERLVSDRLQELSYSMAIGVLMIFLGIFLMVDSTIKLTAKNSPDESSLMGTVDALFGFLCGISLFLYKYFVGKALDSPVVLADSVSSLCSGLTSLAALLVVLLNSIWWVDSTSGFTASLYTLYSGVDTIIASRYEIFRLREEKSIMKLQAAHDSVKKLMRDRNNKHDYGSDDSRDSISYKRDSSNSSRSIVRKLYQSFSFFGSSGLSTQGYQEYDQVPLTESEDNEERDIIFDA